MPMHNERLDYAKSAIEDLAKTVGDPNQKRHLEHAAYAIGVAENRLRALEVVVSRLCKKGGVVRSDFACYSEQLPDKEIGDLLR